MFQLLESVHWVEVSKCCHVLVDEENQLMGAITTEFNIEDGDFHLLWEAESNQECLGAFIGIQAAKWAVQRYVSEQQQYKYAAIKRYQKKLEADKKKKITAVKKKKITTTNKAKALSK